MNLKKKRGKSGHVTYLAAVGTFEVGAPGGRHGRQGGKVRVRRVGQWEGRLLEKVGGVG